MRGASGVVAQAPWFAMSIQTKALSSRLFTSMLSTHQLRTLSAIADFTSRLPPLPYSQPPFPARSITCLEEKPHCPIPL